MAQQICFMVMPFGVKPTGLARGQGPTKVDFDSLWQNALKPLIEDLGYTPFRADADTGALIINEMIERLAYSDIVVADISIPNANVYYEIGIRHAARSTGCVLVSADWARPVFDIAQMRRLTYPLPGEFVTPEGGKDIVEQLLSGIKAMVEEKSPVVHIIPEIGSLDKDLNDAKIHPNQMFDSSAKVKQFQDELEKVQELKVRMDIVQDMPRSTDEEKALMRDAALKIKKEIEASPQKRMVSNSVRLEVLRMLRDCAGFQDVVEYIDDHMPKSLRENPAIKEQRLLALSESKSHQDAATHLKSLIEQFGPSSERYGLLGGRYKRLYSDAKKEGNDREARRNLNKAIEAYENGMNQDLNDYYPTNNLPSLLRARGKKGDLEKARFAAELTVAACERAKKLGLADEWLPQTLLRSAFESEDIEMVEEYVEQVLDDNPANWKLESTLNDIRNSLSLIEEGPTKQRLVELADELGK